MSKLSPYRSLPPERRIALLTHAIKSSREARALYISRIVSRGGGFRTVTFQSWAPDRLAREVIRMKAESAQDEFDLLQMLYVDLEPAIQITFLDAAGVKHAEGKMEESLEAPYADAESVMRAAVVVIEKHGPDGLHYLRTIARYSQDGWPGIAALVSGLEIAT
ncbi:MAG: hypothetical protein ABI681_06480 [Gemmatimonadales bacterium]